MLPIYSIDCIKGYAFATLALKYKVSLESISAMLGHSNIKTTQIYAKITPLKIAEEMKTFAGNQLKEDPQTNCDTIQQARYKVLEIALKMKMKGLDNLLIAELTGLSLKDILLF